MAVSHYLISTAQALSYYVTRPQWTNAYHILISPIEKKDTGSHLAENQWSVPDWQNKIHHMPNISIYLGLVD